MKLICVICHCLSGTKIFYGHVRLWVFIYWGLRNSFTFGLGFIVMVEFGFLCMGFGEFCLIWAWFYSHSRIWVFIYGVWGILPHLGLVL